MAKFGTFRSRLIFLFALATFPAVALALALSWHVYRTAKNTHLGAYRQTAASIAIPERGVIRGAVRFGLTLLAAQPDLAGPACSETLARAARVNTAYTAIAILGPAGVICGVGAVDQFADFRLADLLAANSDDDQTGSVVNEPNAVAVSERGDRAQIAVAVPAGSGRVLAVVVSRSWIERIIADVALPPQASVAIVSGERPVLGMGLEGDNQGWLPRPPIVGRLKPSPNLDRLTSRDGRSFTYALEPIEPGVLYAVAGFPSGRFGPAERQLAIGLLFPFVLFIIVLAVAWIAIDRLFLHWVRRLDATARRLAFGDFSVRARLPEDAPLELRQYATAFDQMTEVLGARTRELATVAQQRSALLRELHHRVKNNFQVIASFLNLMKRERTGETREALAFAECRVHAMAAAYKLALAHGDIRLVPVSVLVEDVVAYAQHAADLRGKPVTLNQSGELGYLHLDRAIPLALLLVETLWPLLTGALAQPDEVTISLAPETIADGGGEGVGGLIRLVVSAPARTPFAPGRFARAFLDQLEARPMADVSVGDVSPAAWPTAGATALASEQTIVLAIEAPMQTTPN